MSNIFYIIYGLIILYLIFQIRKWIKIKNDEKPRIMFFKWNVKNNRLLKEHVLNLLTLNSKLEYFIISFYNNHFIQFLSHPKTNEWYCESVSNSFLSKKNQINVNSETKLIEKGFTKPNEKEYDNIISPNFSKFYKLKKRYNISEIDRPNEIFDEIEYIFNEVYNVSDNDSLKLTFTIPNRSNYSSQFYSIQNSKDDENKGQVKVFKDSKIKLILEITGLIITLVNITFLSFNFDIPNRVHWIILSISAVILFSISIYKILKNKTGVMTSDLGIIFNNSFFIDWNEIEQIQFSKKRLPSMIRWLFPDIMRVKIAMNLEKKIIPININWIKDRNGLIQSIEQYENVVFK